MNGKHVENKPLNKKEKNATAKSGNAKIKECC